MSQEIQIHTPYIELGQLLKFAGVIDQGWEAKVYLSENEVLVNGEPDNRRGRKVYPGDVVVYPGGELHVVAQK